MKFSCYLSLALTLALLAPAGLPVSHAADATGFTVMKHFNFGTIGAYPTAVLIQGTDGTLYGAATQGGSNAYGTVFELDPNTLDFTVLKNFDNTTTGGILYSGLLQGTDGTLYGTASGGGSYGHGTVFKLNPNTLVFTVLKNFDGSTDGDYVPGGLIWGAGGALYGTANRGGRDGYGTVFKLDPNTLDFTVLKNFDNTTTGGWLYGDRLLQGTDGALYGTAYQGGRFGFGTVFKLDPNTLRFTVLMNFDGSTTGGGPHALIEGTGGALYGTATTGGTYGHGTVFKLDRDGNLTVLRHLDGNTTGGLPVASLVQGTDGMLYGAAAEGGSYGRGTVFKVNPNTLDFTVLINFDGSTTGGNPYGPLLQGADGALYGTANKGGEANVGTVFRLEIAAADDLCAGEADGSSCGDAETQCTNQDTCLSGVCQDHGFKSSATSCTGASQGGACDGADHCSGTSNSCVDVFKSAATTCRASANPCDVAESCMGSSGACPADTSMGTFEAHYQAPLNEGLNNLVQKGKVVPVKVSVTCSGVPLPDLAPAIQLLAGDQTAGMETAADEVEILSAAAADTTGVMRAAGSMYIYNLQVPSTASLNALFTIRVRPTGTSGDIRAILKINK